MNMITAVTQTPQKIMRAKIAPEGLYRWNELKSILPCGREKWRLLGLAKRAPQPVRLGTRCTAWRGQDVLNWLDNPNDYVAE